MKVDMNKLTENRYMAIPFADLADMIFLRGGERKNCPKKAVIALIVRLENYYGRTGFGNTVTGQLNEFEAYIATAFLCIKHIDA